VLADVKTLEAHGCYGLGVVSAITYQNDICFDGLDWVPQQQIEQQIQLLLQRLHPVTVKIGLVQNFTVLESLLTFLRHHLPGVPIVWDPVLKASAGFAFHEKWQADAWQQILQQVSIITPNLPEMQRLCGAEQWKEYALVWSRHCAVYVKGGHAAGEQLTDALYTNGAVHTFSATRIAGGDKHGSGCVLSSALAAGLAKGHELPVAAARAHAYTRAFLGSNTSLLGDHQYSSYDED